MEDYLIKLWLVCIWMVNWLFNEFIFLREEVGKEDIDRMYWLLLVVFGKIYKKR